MLPAAAAFMQAEPTASLCGKSARYLVGQELFKTSEARRARCAKALFFPDQTKLIIAALRTLSVTKLQGCS